MNRWCFKPSSTFSLSLRELMCSTIYVTGAESHSMGVNEPFGGTWVYPRVSMARQRRPSDRHACRSCTSPSSVIPSAPQPQYSFMQRCSRYDHVDVSSSSPSPVRSTFQKTSMSIKRRFLNAIIGRKSSKERMSPRVPLYWLNFKDVMEWAIQAVWTASRNDLTLPGGQSPVSTVRSVREGSWM